MGYLLPCDNRSIKIQCACITGPSISGDYLRDKIGRQLGESKCILGATVAEW